VTLDARRPRATAFSASVCRERVLAPAARAATDGVFLKD